jgi:hypothetical protein
MKTRFLTALLHELPGADFQSAAGESRIRRPLRVGGTAALPPRACAPRPASVVLPEPAHAGVETRRWWRFASTWRKKSLNNFISASARKRNC